MINRFFKDMPPKKDLNKLGEWRLEVTTLFPMGENIVYSEVYKGRLWAAYLKVRVEALLKDWKTSGEYYGVGWYIKKVKR